MLRDQRGNHSAYHTARVSSATHSDWTNSLLHFATLSRQYTHFVANFKCTDLYIIKPRRICDLPHVSCANRHRPVCLCVCPSHCGIISTKRDMQFSPNGSLKTLVFVYRCCRNLKGITPARQFSTCTLIQEL